MKHLCHATGCERAVPPKLLMCLKHWSMVPPDAQRAIWQHYVPGQENRKDPTDAYLEAMKNAIRLVAIREGK